MPGAVNPNVDPSSIFWWEELIYCCEYGCKFTAYTYMSQKVPDACQESTEYKDVDVMRDYRKEYAKCVND